MIIKNREKRFIAEFFLEKKRIIFFFSKLEILFCCCNTCCISCSRRHQSVHFFFEKCQSSVTWWHFQKYRVIHMEKWPIFKIFLIKSNCVTILLEKYESTTETTYWNFCSICNFLKYSFLTIFKDSPKQGLICKSVKTYH